jgi:glutathione S-transferase
MKLYWGPHTCAIGIHVLLEEIGRPYETEKVDVAGGAAAEPAFKAINAKGKVPALQRDDGSVLTEFGAIATWLARTNPDKGLIPSDPEDEVRAREIMDYVVGTLHAQGFGRVFKPEKFEPQDVVHGTLGIGQSKVKDQGRAMVTEGFAILDRQLAGREYAGGSRFGTADAALFYAERWAPQVGIDLPSNVAAHFERMKARPAVRRAMAAEGETG